MSSSVLRALVRMSSSTAVSPSSELEAERLAGLLRFAQLLADRGVLKSDLTVEEARDTLWTLNSLAVHDLLIVQRGWSAEQYRDWLAAALAGVALPPVT